MKAFIKLFFNLFLYKKAYSGSENLTPAYLLFNTFSILSDCFSRKRKSKR